MFISLPDDPEERTDLIEEFPEIAEDLELRLAEYVENMVPAYNPDNKPDEADPDNFGGFWSPGWC